MQSFANYPVDLEVGEPSILSLAQVNQKQPIISPLQETLLGQPVAMNAPYFGQECCHPPPSIWKALQHPLDYDIWKHPPHYNGLEPPEDGYVGFTANPEVGIVWDADLIDLGWMRDDRPSRHDIIMFSQPDPRGFWLPSLPAIVVTKEIAPSRRWMWRDPFLDIVPHGVFARAPHEDDAPVVLNPYRRPYGITGG